MVEESVKRKLAAIFYADVVGYSRLTGADEEGTHRTVAAYLDSISEMIRSHEGRIVHYAGDAVLADFASVVAAVRCAVAIQKELAARNSDIPDDRKVQFRIGVNLGDVIVDRDDIYGDGVNIAARLESLAEPGGICISRKVLDEVRGKIDVGFQDMGPQAVKNIEAPVHAYRADFGRAAPTRLAPALSDKPSIAVLPFANLGGDAEQEYFTDGITEDIITALSRLRWFLVIARNSTFVYKNKAVDVKQIGRELGVRYVLEGSIRKAGNRVRITAQLIDASTGTHLWAQNYDRELTDIFALQDEITQSVTATIEPKLVAAEGTRSQHRSAQDLGAWDMVMRALTHYWRMTTKESEAAIALLREAVERYPDYGPAHSLLAFALLVSGHVGWSPERGDYRDAVELAHRALELDSEDPWAHLALGYLAFTEHRTEDSVREFMVALDLNPNFSTAYGYLGWALVFDGQSEEAIRYFEQALRMSPHDPLKAFYCSGTGVAHYYARRYDDAVEWAKRSLRERPSFTAAQRILCASLAQTGRPEETRAALARLRELQPNVSIAWIEQHVPYTPRAMPHFLDGMRKAGLE